MANVVIWFWERVNSISFLCLMFSMLSPTARLKLNCMVREQHA